jgi:hypothetical protein
MKAMTRFLVTLCMAGAITHVAACASNSEPDPELTPAQAAVLPSDTTDPDHQGLGAVLATEVVPDDATQYDNADATPTVDEPVDDNDDPTGDEMMPALSFEAQAALLKFGLHPRASDALRSIGITAGRIMQTIGNAAASAGTHAQDGTVNGHPYSSATDLSVSGLSNTEIQNLLSKLAKVGFAAWFRWPGHDGWPASEVRHIHAVYANSKMKSSLQSQVRSWLVGRNGLIGNAIYGFYTWSSSDKSVVRGKFAESAEGTTNAGSTCFVGGLYCGGDKISGSASTLYRCTGTGAPTVVKTCARGCSVNSGSDDSCK